MRNQKPVAFTRCDNGADAQEDVTPTMRCGSNHSAHLAAAIPINGMTLNKELKDKQMTGIGGGRRPYVFREVKRTTARRGRSQYGRRQGQRQHHNGWQLFYVIDQRAARRSSRRISTMLWSAQGYAVISHGLRAADNAGPRPSNVPCRHGRPQTHPSRVRAIAGISRRSHAHRVARQVAAGLPGWPALQGAGQQHGRSLHGVDRQTHCRAEPRPSALRLRMQRHRGCLSRMGAAGLGACGLCRGGEVSERGPGASLAASAELGGYDTP